MRTTIVTFVALLALLSSQSAFAAGKVAPTSIVVAKAKPIVNATAHFTCELRAFNDPNVACYQPDTIRAAYGLKHLIAGGINGHGETIVIIDAFGSPTAAADLAQFDTEFGLPAPPSFSVFHMPGSTPFDYTNADQLGWAEETSLDVQWSHAIAPAASIIVIAAVDDNDVNIIAAQNYALDHHLGHIISESFGESEIALLQDGAEGAGLIAAYEQGYRRARASDISVLVSSGDDGASAVDINGNLIPVAAPNYPASSPNVTTVGGTNLFFGTPTNADPNGTYQSEVVWNDGFGAGGGGISHKFDIPDYQRDSLSDAKLHQLHGARGYPDIAYNAGVRTGVLVYLGFLDTAFGPGNNGFYVFGGTSAGAPQWAAITALGNQLGHHPLGFLNTRLYNLARLHILQFLMHDVTVGNNSFNGVTGFSATPSWDLTTGWGTPNEGFLFSLIAGPNDDFDEGGSGGHDGDHGGGDDGGHGGDHGGW